MAETIQSIAGAHNARATSASMPVETSQNEADARIGSDDRLFLASNDGDDLKVTRTRRPKVPAPLSQQDTRTAVSALWDVYQASRKAMGLPDKGLAHDKLKARVEQFVNRPVSTKTKRDDLLKTCQLFASLEEALKRHKGGRNVAQFDRAMNISRGLKWQFKASADECVKRRLDKGLWQRLDNMKPGSTTAFSAKVGAGVDVVPGVGVNASVTHDSSLSITPTEWLVDASGKKITLSADADVLDFIETELSLSGASSRAEIYASLSDYVSSESHKFSTWIKQGPIALIGKIRDLFLISSSYESTRARADFSCDWLEDDLIALCGKGVDIVRRGPVTGAIERHDTLAGEIRARAGVDFGVTASLAAAGRRLVTIKRARHDILSIADAKPEIARQLLANRQLVCNPETLLEAMRGHVKQSSNEITTELMARRPGFAVQDMEARARFLLEQFALLKLSGDLDPEVEAILMDLFHERERMFRPPALAVHELSCRQSKWQAEIAGVAGIPFVFPNGVNATVTYEKVSEDEDPHYCGHFLNVNVSGIVAVAGAVVGSLEAAGIGANTVWGVSEIQKALAATDFDYSAGVMTSMRFKLKEDGVALMHSVRGITSTLGGSRKVPTPVSFIAGLAWNSNTADHLTIGSSCLDLLAPMMRMRYANPRFGGEQWWQDFSTLHRAELDAMYFKIADASEKTLETDLQRIVREVPSTGPLLDTLRNAATQFSDEATPQNRSLTNQAMAEFMLAYVKGGYAEKVSGNWTSSVRGQRAGRSEGGAASAQRDVRPTAPPPTPSLTRDAIAA
ncbi:hypothetical protein PCA20602_01623 [Pandoraea capi]|uniref:Uncharacterized protein n=1 Tax=Pandoraea capi TaxID=2508286 RepID=A0ABY6VW40_9BURK|nr:hypothetical protein [Pandoraea capi]VVD90963.1 hypothetical protein PCA20602_01623 [Pandoraea capi]